MRAAVVPPRLWMRSTTSREACAACVEASSPSRRSGHSGTERPPSSGPRFASISSCVSITKARAARSVASHSATPMYASGWSFRVEPDIHGVFTIARSTSESIAPRAMPSATAALLYGTCDGFRWVGFSQYGVESSAFWGSMCFGGTY